MAGRYCRAGDRHGRHVDLLHCGGTGVKIHYGDTTIWPRYPWVVPQVDRFRHILRLANIARHRGRHRRADNLLALLRDIH